MKYFRPGTTIELLKDLIGLERGETKIKKIKVRKKKENK
jgi:hypothetical protein